MHRRRVVWSGPGDPIDDDGRTRISATRLAELVEEPSAGCEVDLVLSRVSDGSVDDDFRADRATAIVRRSVTVTLAP